MKSKSKMISIWSLTAVGTLLASALAWKQLDLPRPALDTEVKAVAQEFSKKIHSVNVYSRGTRALLLQNDRRYLDDKIDQLRQRKKDEPKNHDLQRRIDRNKGDLKEINRQLKVLR